VCKRGWKRKRNKMRSEGVGTQDQDRAGRAALLWLSSHARWAGLARFLRVYVDSACLS